MTTGTGTIMRIRIIMGTIMGMFIMNTTGMISAGPRARSAGRAAARAWIIVSPLTAALLASAISASGQQPSGETLRAENEYRECLYSKSRSGRYAHGERESDFGLIGECRNQWVAYMDVCTKAGFDNATCVMKSRLVIHAILNLTGK
jgi:hypothetical protein